MSSLTTITLLPKPTTPKPAEAPSSPDKRVQFAWQVKGLTKASFHMKAATALRTAIADLSFIALDTVFVDQVTDEKEETGSGSSGSGSGSGSAQRRRLLAAEDPPNGVPSATVMEYSPSSSVKVQMSVHTQSAELAAAVVGKIAGLGGANNGALLAAVHALNATYMTEVKLAVDPEVVDDAAVVIGATAAATAAIATTQAEADKTAAALNDASAALVTASAGVVDQVAVAAAKAAKDAATETETATKKASANAKAALTKATANGAGKAAVDSATANVNRAEANADKAATDHAKASANLLKANQGTVDKATLAVVHPHPRFVMCWISWCSHPLLDGRRECSRLITEEEI